MNILRLVATGTAVLIVGGCEGRDAVGPAAPPLAEQGAALAVAASAYAMTFRSRSV